MEILVVNYISHTKALLRMNLPGVVGTAYEAIDVEVAVFPEVLVCLYRYW